MRVNTPQRIAKPFGAKKTQVIHGLQAAVSLSIVMLLLSLCMFVMSWRGGEPEVCVCLPQCPLCPAEVDKHAWSRSETSPWGKEKSRNGNLIMKKASLRTCDVATGK